MNTMADSACISMSRWPVRGILSVLGGFLVHLTLSTVYVFGNMNPYVTSYLRGGDENSTVRYTQTIWISIAQSISMAGSMPVLGLLEQRIHPKYCALIGSWIFSLGMALTYWTVRHSLGLTILTYGVIHGAGKGMAYPAAVKCGLEWFPKRKGLVTGLIIAGIGGGTFVFNEVITHFINPNNLLPETSHRGDLYFSQSVLLDKVPYCFLLLGGVDAGIQLFAVLLISKPKPGAPENSTLTEDVHQSSALAEDVHQNSTLTEDIHQNSPLIEDIQMNQVLQGSENKENNGESEALEVKPSSNDERKTDFAPWEVLRTKIFYLMWIIFLCVVLGIFFVTNFYKTFSQTFIKDDHFLSLAGSISSVLNALGRPFWGAVGDRLGYRETLVIVCIILGSASATFTLCEYGGKVMLIIWMCLIYGTFSGFFCIMPSLNVSIFGHKYYSSNYGLLMSAMIVIQIVGGLLTSQLKDTIGWKGILYIGAGGVILSMFLSAGMMIHHRRQRKKHRM
ncbi:monocarboxylate transporter 9-like isoform X2 [Haliotis rubra]|uniref:monocarboxylate transporter 9-like isoform X2 n=1 Tax=Haliotis rubra TaxID=36100 RepID=UPI001EE59E99|nr:monocarboxylate transporter 9-like isoform X2 [Haliotis rubra]